MNRMNWTDDDRAEHEALMNEAWGAGGTIRRQIDALLSGVRDAVQAQRAWAEEIEEEALRSGLGDHLKRWRKEANRIRAKRGDRVVDRPGVVGVRRASPDGVEVAVQLELDLMSLDELQVKRRENMRQIIAYSDNNAVIDALITLVESVPEATNPREAAETLGTTVNAWLMGEAA